MNTIVRAALLLLLSASPLLAQTRPSSANDYPSVAPRGFVEFSRQQFAAHDTFDAIFGDSSGSFRGFGLDLVLARNIFIEVSGSRFDETGERVFRSEGKNFPLGIPLTVTITPIEVIGGFRLTKWTHLIPYAGAGLGSFKYEESSEFDTADEAIDVSKNGFLLLGGVEWRLFRWVGVTADVHYSHVSGLIGSGGISKEFSEDDLGGTAFRFRVMVGR